MKRIRFDAFFEVLERVAPELADPRPQLAQAFRAGSVQAACAGATFGEQAYLAQDTEVLRDGWTGDVRELRGDLARGALDVAYQAQDRATTWIGQRIEDGPVKHGYI